MSSTTLSPPQLEALLDILVHHETYSEVLSFRDPEAIDRYGYPFIDAKTRKKACAGEEKSASPMLQLLLTRVVLPVPGVRDLPPEFWNEKFKGIMRRFGDAELSESYDKGTLGLRKRLASAASVIHESVTRGLLNGVPIDRLPNLRGQYDAKNAEDLVRAWDDSVHQLVYGNLIDELFEQFTNSGDIEAHSPAVKAAVEYAIIYLATFLHHVFVLSPEGPYLLKLLSNVHTLIPYTVMGQTLRIGNAGTMIAGFVRLFLAKVSVGAFSNWIGLTQGASDGMNLLQRIISLVLGWDAGDFRKVTDNIRKGSEKSLSERLVAIDEHIEAPREQHNTIRQKSVEEKKSIVTAILESKDLNLAKGITDAQHAQCLDYYSALLAIRDRDKIVDVLCRQTPDLVTSIVRDGVSVFEPMIRTIHKKVDLKKHFGAFQSFLDDLIGTSKSIKVENGSKEKRGAPPSVEDYVELLQRNRHLLYAYLHDFAEGCPELRDTWRDWMKDAIKVFQQKPATNGRTQECTENSKEAPGVRGVNAALQNMFDQLPEDIKLSVRDTTEAHSVYLSTLENITKGRIQRIVDSIGVGAGSRGRVMMGPGMYASRWQQLLDDTIITAGTPYGPPRRGEDVKGLKAPGKTGAVTATDTLEPVIIQQEDCAKRKPPDVSVVVDALGSQFKNMIADMASRGLPRRSRTWR
ncbi:PX-associated-domain-containing protein [Biscogniauxia mediterranea]|nr:PX-associated-domain-containing protein [Biscogniauxia mediterranea]